MEDTEELDSWDNVYSAPEKFGLAIVTQLEQQDLLYAFDEVVVWRDKDGELYFAHDAGCSCPSPFEDYKSVESLTPLRHLSDLDDVVKPYPYGDASAFLRTVRDAWATLRS